MLLLFPNDWRKLRKLITWLLSSGLVSEVLRMNYVQSFTKGTAHPGKKEQIQKADLKLLKLFTQQPEKVQAFVNKQFPEGRFL